MRRLLILLACIAFFIGCGPKYQDTLKSDIQKALQPSSLRYAFNTQPINLKDASRCKPDSFSVNIRNVEKVNQDIYFIPWRPFLPGWYINPHDVAGHITEYLSEAYRQCRVPTNNNSTKIITISAQILEGYYGWNSWITIKTTVNIPEKNIIIPITATQTTLNMYDAVAYTIHDISWQIVNDPTIQDYILCR